MSHAGTPAAEIAIDEALVRELLSEQFPDLSHLALHPAASGWDNVMFRLGDAHAVRLPRRAAATTALRTEQHWLGRLGALGVDVPVPLRHGVPSSRYPWPWSVVPWLPGHPADERPIEAGEAARLGAVLQQLHAPAPPDAPVSPYRGVPLHARATDMEARLGRALAGDDALRAMRRALGWALFFGVSLLDAGMVDDPRHAATGLATLRRLAISSRGGDATAGTRSPRR